MLPASNDHWLASSRAVSGGGRQALRHYKSNLRDIEFNLFEVLRRQDLLGAPPGSRAGMLSLGCRVGRPAEGSRTSVTSRKPSPKVSLMPQKRRKHANMRKCELPSSDPPCRQPQHYYRL